MPAENGTQTVVAASLVLYRKHIYGAMPSTNQVGVTGARHVTYRSPVLVVLVRGSAAKTPVRLHAFIDHAFAPMQLIHSRMKIWVPSILGKWRR